MKKIAMFVLLLITVLVLVGCAGQGERALAPPKWIQGTWYCATFTGGPLTLKFTKDNLVITAEPAGEDPKVVDMVDKYAAAGLTETINHQEKIYEVETPGITAYKFSYDANTGELVYDRGGVLYRFEKQ